MAEAIGQIRVEASIGTAEYVAGARKIKAETASLERDVKTRFAGLGAAVKGGIAGLVGALSVGAFVNLGRAALKYASDLGDVSQQLGVTTKDLQTLRYAAGQLGVSQGELEKGLENLTKTLGRVAVGAEKPAKALQAIGLNAQQVAQMDTGAAFRTIADALSQVTDRAQRAAVETALFGEAGAKLDTMLSGGSAALNELANAAERLGIVLSDEQIQKADETADKLDAMKTVLSARIAGIVADNADSILGLANALEALVGTIAGAINAWRQMEATFNSNVFSMFGNESAAARWRGANFQSGKQSTIPGRSVTVSLPPARAAKAPVVRGVNVGDFLAKGSRGGRSRTGRAPRDDSARDLFRFQQEELRAQMDIVRAKQQVAEDYIARTALSIQLLDLERQAYQQELDFEVSQKDKTAAQAATLMALYDQRDALERQAVLAEEEAQRYEDSVRLDAVSLELERDKLESEAALADTAKEQRDIALRLLDLSYAQERARQEAVLADKEASFAAKEEARRRLAALNGTYGNAREAVMQGTQGPWEQFANASTDAGKLEEAFQSVAVNGVGALTDGLIDAISGVKSLGEAFRQVAQQIIQDLLRIMIQKMIVQAIGGLIGGGIGGGGGVTTGTVVGGGGSSFGALPSFAGGGGMNILGRPGIDRNVLSLNGLPIANVSYGERLNIGNDNAPANGGSFVINVTAPDTGNPTRDRRTAHQHGAIVRNAIADVAKRGY